MSFRENEVTVGIQRSEMRLRLDCHASLAMTHWWDTHTRIKATDKASPSAIIN